MRAGLAVSALAVTATGAVPLIATRVPARRARQSELVRLRHALAVHADPGPGLRTQADVLARRLLRLAWIGRCLPVLPAVLLLQADWSRPGAGPAAVVLLACYAVLHTWHRRRTRDARRWLTAPPGPERAEPPPPWWESWLGGRRLLGLTCGYAVAVVVVVFSRGG